MAAASLTPPLRTLREFAEQEIVIPTGRYAGLRYSCARQPYSRLWFEAVDSARWRRIVTTGPSQSGKTLMGFVIPILYHLFEVVEDVILGAPSMEIAKDKWSRDLLPVIRRTRYRDFLPRSGAGSRGGKSDIQAIEFGNGAWLRFMTGGGDDKSRSNYTARVLAITETDGLDEVSEGSREADKVAQMEARTQSFDDLARIYMECTVSIEEGRTWQEIKNGTDSRIAARCPHCRHYVKIERENLTGWQNAEDEIAAGEQGAFACPECSAVWTEEERVAANHDCLLVHKGQEITPDGAVTGQAPRTSTLGFRWNAANNLLLKTATIARKEWTLARRPDEDNAQKEACQFWWAVPFKPEASALNAMDAPAILKRATQDPKGRVPAGSHRITLGIDVGKWLCHWTALAWKANATPHVLEYGRIEVPTKELGEERAILAALRGFRDTVWKQGWPADDGVRYAEWSFIDCGNWQDLILIFCGESERFHACKGFGIDQLNRTRNVGDQTEAGWKVMWAPPNAGYELIQHPNQPARILDVQADRWKSWLHARLQTPMGQPGAFTLHQGNDHLGYAKQLLAEKKEETFVHGKGLVTRWVKVHRNNHGLDSTALACVAGHVAGERLMGEAPAEPIVPRQVQQTQPRDRPDWMPERPDTWMNR